jgi:cytochrome c biogenesis protein CcmG, thiol:disulfide interchange protein DsbE
LRAANSAGGVAPVLRRAISCSLFAALVLAFVGAAHSGTAAAPQSLLNKPAPAFSLKDLKGQALEIAHFRGKVVLLNFWATWCAPCQVEMPVFAEWQNQYGPQGLQVIGISMDDSAGSARRLVTRLNLNYPVAMGSARLGTRFGGVLGLPLTFVIDRNGVICARYQGETDLKTIEKQIQLLLAR